MKTNRLTIAWLASTPLLGASCFSCSDGGASIEKEVGKVLRIEPAIVLESENDAGDPTVAGQPS